jgi:phosphatidylserine/phosphatidylglycerophosphate/cardiolipin synthase-like enzyme
MSLYKKLPLLLVFTLTLLGGSGCYHTFKPLPRDISYLGDAMPCEDPVFLKDLTYWDTATDQRVTDQEIFDRVFQMIGDAREFILVDMFLFNEFQGEVPEHTRALCQELTDALVAKKRAIPELQAYVITDPINTVYGGLIPEHFHQLSEAGVKVLFTDLARLRDSNPSYSLIWRILIRPWENNPSGGWLPNPFGEGEVTIRSYLAMANLKANHRKVVLADKDEDLVALVTSANPHDGSSAHGNIALQFSGPAAWDLFKTEVAVLRFCRFWLPYWNPPSYREHASGQYTIQIATEGKISQVVLRAIDDTEAGDQIRLVMFYISDRRIVRALEHAYQRGVRVEMILDPNKDAFGRSKGGIPNRQVACELHRMGIPIRWADTHGEQCHSKILLVDDPDTGQSTAILGSANYTRRNLRDLNLETDIVLRGEMEAEAFREMRDYFQTLWTNPDGRVFTADYEKYADPSRLKRWSYLLMEWTGMCAF